MLRILEEMVDESDNGGCAKSLVYRATQAVMWYIVRALLRRKSRLKYGTMGEATSRSITQKTPP